MTFEIVGYDWGTFYLWLGIICAGLLLLGAVFALPSEGVSLFIAAFLGIFGVLFLWIGFDHEESSHVYSQKVAGIESFGYEDVESSSRGYNQWVASKEGEFVTLAVTLVEENTYLVTEIQE